jgi:translation initiation factor IF-2
MAETKVGEVFIYFQKAMVAAVKITGGALEVGDRVHFIGNTTDLTQAVESMQVEDAQIRRAQAGDQVGIKVAGRVRPHDAVYRVE